MSLTRRSFLLNVLSAGGATAAAAQLPGCAPRYDPAPFVTVAAPVDGKLTLAVADFPALAAAGGAVIARAPGLDPPVLLLHAPDGGFRAMSALCTHAGCPVGYDAPEVVCPCHLSRFDLDGRVTHPPARAGLSAYAASFDAGTGVLTVDLAAGTPAFPALVAGQVIFALAQFPALAIEGGTVTGTPAGYGKPIIVIALAGGAFAALDARCTHLGCTVEYDAASGQLPCPCHGSIFALDGSVLLAPATAPLAVHSAISDGTAVTVTIG
jgi:Rieske Fe-S protein